MVIDGKAMFVGSSDFDPRSMHPNNEIGILFYEPNLAKKWCRNLMTISMKWLSGWNWLRVGRILKAALGRL
jgi:phosphatidylserine/phosphatidylglycerophosphate/cardiolipin synthase-like enzyme